MSPVESVAVGSYGKRPTIIRQSDCSAVIIDPTVDVDQQTVKRRPDEVFKCLRCQAGANLAEAIARAALKSAALGSTTRVRSSFSVKESAPLSAHIWPALPPGLIGRLGARAR